jgi:predicted ATPase
LTLLYGLDLSVITSAVLICVEQLLGKPDQALNRERKALEHASQLDHVYSRAFPLAGHQWFFYFRREAQVVQGLAEATKSLCSDHGFAELLAWAKCLGGWAICELGRSREGLQEMSEGMAGLKRAGGSSSRSMFLGMLVEACGKDGDSKRALELLAEAVDWANRTGERFYESELHRLRGEMLLKQNKSNASEAKPCFERAIEIARNQSAKSLELRATVSLARLLAEQGRYDEARMRLADVYGWFTEGFDTADLKDAKSLLDELAG